MWTALFRKTFEIAPDLDLGRVLSFVKSQLSDVKCQTSDIACSIYVGSRKYNLPLFDAESGKPLGHARAYFPEHAEYGKNEVRILEELECTQLENFSFPKVLGKWQAGGFFIVALSALPKGTKRMKGIERSHLEFLKCLSEKTGTRLKFEDSNFYAEFQKEVEQFGSAMPEARDLIEYFWNTSRKNLEVKEFLFSLTKREFPFFEMFKPNIVLDWEHARFGWPAIFDAYSLVLSDAPGRRGDYTELYAKNIISLFFEKNKKHFGFLKDALRIFGATKEGAYSWFFLFLLDQLFIHWDAGHIRSAERVLAFFRYASEHEGELKTRWLAN